MSSKLKERKLPQGWRWAQLGEVADIFSGSSAPQGSDFFSTSGFPFVRVSDLSESGVGGIIYKTRDRLSDIAIFDCLLKKAPKGAVVLPKSGAAIATNRRALLGIDAYIVSHLLALVAIPALSLKEWVYFALRQIDMMDYSDNTGYPSLKKSVVEKIEIPLPPLSEQKRIVADLNKKMVAVEKVRAATLERVEAIRTLPAAFLREVFSFNDGKLPRGWRWVLLSEVCSFIRGVNFKKSVVSYTPVTGYLPILRAGNIGAKLNTKDDLIWISRDRISKEQLLRIGDIVVCMSSGSPSVVGKTASLQKEWAGSIGAFCGIIRTKDIQHSQYLSLWFRSPNYLKWRDMQARGANIQNLRVSEFENISIPLPPLSEQKRIVADLNKKMTAIEKARDAAEAESEATHALLAAFLREAFSGAL